MLDISIVMTRISYIETYKPYKLMNMHMYVHNYIKINLWKFFDFIYLLCMH